METLVTEDVVRQVPARLLRLLLYLKMHEGEPLPISEIASQLQQRERSVFRNLRDAEHLGLVQRQGMRGKANSYTVKSKGADYAI